MHKKQRIIFDQLLIKDVFLYNCIDFQNDGLEVQSNIPKETKMHFKTLLLIVHYYALRSACRQVQTMKSICVKISVALLRYTDIIPADKAFYEAGIKRVFSF